MNSPSNPTLPAPSILRKLLGTLFLSDSDFDAFCLDNFRDVHRRFSAGMDRVCKTNLLLLHVEPTDILSQLRKDFGHSSQKLILITSHLNELDTEEKQKAAELGLRLRRLSIERHRRRLANLDTAELDADIVAIKREQRQFPQLQAGEVLSDRYELLESIGKGGFARIWQAYDHSAERLVAVKVLHAEASDEPRRVERFIRGARQMKELHHSHIARVLDGPGEWRGFHYFVMDYFAGGDLARAVVSGRLTHHKALEALLDIGQALAYAHKNQVIHRDVKPENILLDMQGKAYLTDFDLVWAAGTTGGTRTGFLGTYMYVSPEQAENAQSVDVRADVYALGMTVLFVLYGKSLPHRAIRQRVMFIADLGCSATLKAIVRQATADDPEDRPQSITAFCDELAHCLAPVLSPNPLPIPPQPPKPEPLKPIEIKDRVMALGRRRLWAGAFLVSVLLIIVSGVPFSWLHGQQRPGMIDSSHQAATSPTVKWLVLSVPARAEVIRSADNQRLGYTPLTLEHQRSTGVAELIVRLPGHEEKRANLPLFSDETLNVVLTKLPEQPLKPSSTPAVPAPMHSIDAPALAPATAPITRTSLSPPNELAPQRLSTQSRPAIPDVKTASSFSDKRKQVGAREPTSQAAADQAGKSKKLGGGEAAKTSEGPAMSPPANHADALSKRQPEPPRAGASPAPSSKTQPEHTEILPPTQPTHQASSLLPLESEELLKQGKQACDSKTDVQARAIWTKMTKSYQTELESYCGTRVKFEL